VRDDNRHGEPVWLLMRSTGLHCRHRGPAAVTDDTDFGDFGTAGASSRVRKNYI